MKRVLVLEGDIEAIAGCVSLRDGDRRLIQVDAHDLGRSRSRRGKCKAPRVGHAVKDTTPRGERGDVATIVSLVHEESGLVAVGKVDPKRDPVLGDRDPTRQTLRPRKVDLFLSRRSFIHDHKHLVDVEDVPQGAAHDIKQVHPATAEEGDHGHRRIAVHDQARETVSFRVHHAPRIAHLREAQRVNPQVGGGLQPRAEPRLVWTLAGGAREHAQGNLARPVGKGEAHRAPLLGRHLDDIATLDPAVHVHDALLIDERMGRGSAE